MRERSRGSLAPLTRLLILAALVLLPCPLTGADVARARPEAASREAVEAITLLRTSAGLDAAARLRDRCHELGIEPGSIAFVDRDYAFTDAGPAPVGADDAPDGSIDDEDLWVTVEIRSASIVTADDVLSVLDLGAAVLDVGQGHLVVRTRRTDVASLRRLRFASEVEDHRADLIVSADRPQWGRRYLVQSYAGDRRSFRQALEGAGAAIGRFEPIGQYYDVTSAADLGPVLRGAWWVRRAVDVHEFDRRAHEARAGDPETEARARIALAEAWEQAAGVAAETERTIVHGWVRDGVFLFLQSDGSVAAILRTSLDRTLNFGDPPFDLPMLVAFDDRQILSGVPVGQEPHVVPPPDHHATDDTYADSANPGTNYSTALTLKVGGGTMQGFIRASGIFLPSSYTATSVKLMLYADGFGASPERWIAAYPITSAWEEETLTWNVRPSRSSVADDSRLFHCLIIGGCAAWYSWDVTTTAKSWISGQTSNYGHALTAIQGTAVTFTSNGSPYYHIEFSLSCSFALSKTSMSFTGSAGSDTTLTVTGSPSGCAGSWSATDNASWMTISPTSGMGASTTAVTVSVDANTTGAGRTGTITFTGTFSTGKTVTVTQAPQCAFALNRSSYQVSYSAGTYADILSVTGSPSGCTGGWSATDDAAWLASSPASSSGAGTTGVSLTVQENATGAARTGRITFVPNGSLFPTGSVFTLDQTASCLFTLSSTSQTVPASGGAYSVSVTGGPYPCTGEWTATESLDWLRLSGVTSGGMAGTTSVPFVVDPLPAGVSSRQGSISFAGRFSGSSTLTVTQAQGACTYALSATSRSIPSSGGGPYSVSVTGGPAGCVGGWSASKDVSWLTYLMPTTGSGSGTTVVTYSVEPNVDAARTGHVFFSGTFSTDSVVTVSQSGVTGGCTPDSSTLCLLQSKFAVSLDARDQRTGKRGTGRAIPGNDFFGYFSLPALTFDETNPEVFVKILDGRPVNGRYWVFYGTMTDFELTLTVRDTDAGATMTYRKPDGSACGGFDTGAFGKGFAWDARGDDGKTLEAFPVPPYIDPPAAPRGAVDLVQSPEAGCTAGPNNLCLSSSRFRVTLLATDHRTGKTGVGLAIPQNGLFGYFSIPDLTFNPDNPEVFVKVLDGRAVNGKFWVFYGSLTDLRLEIRVVDTQTSSSKTYTRVGGSACGGFDTAAF